jgi:hypothetical protein
MNVSCLLSFIPKGYVDVIKETSLGQTYRAKWDEILLRALSEPNPPKPKWNVVVGVVLQKCLNI